MSFRLDQLLKASTVRVSTAGKAYEGMGFFFAPGLALTSAHVVAQAEGEMVQVFLAGEQHAVPAEVKYRFPEDVGLVILQVQTTEVVPCAYLDADIKPGDQGYTFGCTGTSRKVHRVMVECEGMMGSAIGISHLAGRSKHLQLNGSPILNQRTGKICGIVHTPRKQDGYRGEAVPMGIIFSEFPALSILQKEYHCQDNRWTTLLHPDLEALNADWTYYNRGWIRREQSIRALLFLLRTASQWSIIGARMRHVFPWRSMIALIKATFRGTLGTEIQRQYHQITRQLTSTIDPHSVSQARALHRLDAQSWVVSSLMELLITPEQDYASSSRLLWMLEILQEQRVYVQTLKRMPGNFYPQLEEFKRRWKLLEHDDKYIDTSRVLSGLINRNTDTNFSLWYTIKFFLKDFVQDLAQNSKLSAHGLERLFNMLVVNLRHAVPAPTASVEDLLRDLEEEVRLNPDLKVLQKVQILMTSVSGEVVQGGPYRALKGSGTYHFSPKCKLYPERAQAEEMARIICYDTEAQARQQHKPCKNCLTAEKMLDRRLSDWHDSDPTIGGEVATPMVSDRQSVIVPQATQTTVPQPEAVSNLITPDFRPHQPLLQLPVTDRATAAAPAADAPMPEFIDRARQPIVLPPLPAVPPRVVAVKPEVAAVEPEVTAVEPEVIAAVEPAVVATPEVVAEAPIAITTADVSVPVEAEHHDDTEAVSAQVEVELAAAIAEVAKEIAAERDQPATVAAQTTQAIDPPPIAEIVAAADLHALNTDMASEEEEEVFEMAAFFVPDGNQPAIAMTETAVAEITKVAPRTTTKAAAKAAAKVTEVAVVAPKVEAKAEPQVEAKVEAKIEPKVATKVEAKVEAKVEVKTEPKVETKVEPKVATKVEAKVEPKVEATVEPKVATKVATKVEAKVEVKTEPKVEAAVAPKAEPPVETTVTTKVTKTKTVKAPAAPIGTAEVAPIAPETIATPPETVTAKPASKAKAPKQTKTLKDFVAAISSANRIETKATAKANPVDATPVAAPTSRPAATTPGKVAAKAAPQASKSVKVPTAAVQPEAVTPEVVAPTVTTPEVTPSTSTKAKAKGDKVTRLADWAPTEAPIDAVERSENESGVVQITDAKSVRNKRSKAAAKTTTTD